MTDKKRKKVCLLHLFSNGDCLYVTAIAKQIKQDFPGCELTWVIAAFCKDIINNNPYVDKSVVIDDVSRNDLPAFRRLRKRFVDEKARGLWDELFVTLNVDENQAYYDGCIRTGIYRAYPRPITVDTTPVLRLSETEKASAAAFAVSHRLESYKHRLLFEFAPQSGQLPITMEFAIGLAEKLVADPDVAVILSSSTPINHPNPAIIDGSVLTLRETAALSFFCTQLLGCSSGITWATTSDGAWLLPMIQVIDPDTPWINPVSRDFERWNRSTENIIDLMGVDESKILGCVQTSFKDFSQARKKYNEPIPLKFNTTRKIVYNLLCQLQFAAVATHIRVNREVYGNQPEFNKQVLLAAAGLPFTLVRNFINKRLLATR